MDTAPVIDHAAFAERIRAAYSRATIAPIRGELPGATLDDAYVIQAHNVAHWMAAGRQVVGAKIGLTSQAVQAQLGVDQPDFGMLFADMQIDDGGTVAPGRLLLPKAEGEIAFRLGTDLGAVDGDVAKAAAAVAYALPAIEIVDSRIAGWDIRMIDTVADNASSGLFVLGTTPVDISGIDLAACTMQLARNGETVSQGQGAACMGSPLNALAWLADARARWGTPLKAGEIILAGALGPMVEARPGDAFHATIAGIGSVSVRFGD